MVINREKRHSQNRKNVQRKTIFFKKIFGDLVIIFNHFLLGIKGSTSKVHRSAKIPNLELIIITTQVKLFLEIKIGTNLHSIITPRISRM